MRDYKTSILFEKKIKKLKGKELKNILNKIDDIISSETLNLYKNLKYDLSKYKRVHVNDSYILLFFGDDEIIYFVDYEHHDKIYKHSKKNLKKYDNLKFS